MSRAMSVEKFFDAHNSIAEYREWAVNSCRTMDEVWGKACADLVILISFLDGVLTDKERRLYAAMVVRKAQHLIKDQSAVDAIGVAEKYANGKASDQELLDACRLSSGRASDHWIAAVESFYEIWDNDPSKQKGGWADEFANWLRLNTKPNFSRE